MRIGADVYTRANEQKIAGKKGQRREQAHRSQHGELGVRGAHNIEIEGAPVKAI